MCAHRCARAHVRACVRVRVLYTHTQPHHVYVLRITRVLLRVTQYTSISEVPDYLVSIDTMQNQERHRLLRARLEQHKWNCWDDPFD